MELTFDRAIELLEITDIKSVNAGDLPGILKKARRRWHPDRVAHQRDPALTSSHTEAFQMLEPAGQMIEQYLSGAYQAGDAFTAASSMDDREVSDVLRENAPDIQTKLKSIWQKVKSTSYKMTTEKVQLSDGFKLRDLLNEDLKDDIALLGMIALVFGGLFMMVATGLSAAVAPPLVMIVGPISIVYFLACVLSVAPLSRFWLPSWMSNFMVGCVNFGLKIYRFVAPPEDHPEPGLRNLLVGVPTLFAKVIKWFIIWPLYQIAKMIIGDKVVGVVTQDVRYYAGASDWYVEELLNKPPAEMDEEELLHLSHLYTELMEVTT